MQAVPLFQSNFDSFLIPYSLHTFFANIHFGCSLEKRSEATMPSTSIASQGRVSFPVGMFGEMDDFADSTSCQINHRCGLVKVVEDETGVPFGQWRMGVSEVWQVNIGR